MSWNIQNPPPDYLGKVKENLNKNHSLLYPTNDPSRDKARLDDIRFGIEQTRQHNINKLLSMLSPKPAHHNLKYLSPNFRGLFENDPEHRYKIYTQPMPHLGP